MSTFIEYDDVVPLPCLQKQWIAKDLQEDIRGMYGSTSGQTYCTSVCRMSDLKPHI